MISQHKLTHRLRTARYHLDKYLGPEQHRPARAPRVRRRGAMQRAVEMLRGALRR